MKTNKTGLPTPKTPLNKCPACQKQNAVISPMGNKLTIICLDCGYVNNNYQDRKIKAKTIKVDEKVLFKIEDIEIEVLRLLWKRINEETVENINDNEIKMLLSLLGNTLKIDYENYFNSLNKKFDYQKKKLEFENDTDNKT